VTITREGNRLMAQPKGKRKVEVFPESETEFFLKVADVQLTFLKDDEGKVTHVVLHQGGRETKAKRLEPDEVKARETEKPKDAKKDDQGK
jgi:Domain of unknown function (DUF3471)